ncbi:MAG: hypothetical protein ABMB14_06040 [Myxococcota bacterium]
MTDRDAVTIDGVTVTTVGDPKVWVDQQLVDHPFAFAVAGVVAFGLAVLATYHLAVVFVVGTLALAAVGTVPNRLRVPLSVALTVHHLEVRGLGKTVRVPLAELVWVERAAGRIEIVTTTEFISVSFPCAPAERYRVDRVLTKSQDDRDRGSPRDVPRALAAARRRAEEAR